jgi:hypothetical protein
MAGSYNAINILQCSYVFSRLAKGNTSVVNYKINDHAYDKIYYLADDTYPD